MMKGDVGAKASLGHYLGPGHVHGLGALENLSGEATFDDGVLWISRVSASGEIETQRFRSGTPFGGQAALLGVSRVPSWTATILRQATPLPRLEHVVRQEATRLGISPKEPVPFRIEGVLESLSFHVIDGSRLQAGPSSHEAHRESAISVNKRSVRAHLIGFEGSALAGELVHRGSSTHIHVTMVDPLVSGHVDEVTVAAGARLLLPAGAHR